MWPFDDVLDAVNALFDFLVSLFYLVMYFPMSLVITLYNSLIEEVNILVQLGNCPIDLFNVLNDNMFSIFDGVMFDSVVNWIFLLTIGVAVAFRIYHFLNGVSVFGWKL